MLSHDSALCERICVAPTQLRLGRLYRAADVLLRNRKAIETALYERQCELFAHSCTVVLYDLTNTWFTGAAHSAPGEFGHSKQKRHDCPLVTLGLCLDSAGLVPSKRSAAGQCIGARHAESSTQAAGSERRVLHRGDGCRNLQR